jgi:precorrin-3B C17-methyltransferase
VVGIGPGHLVGLTIEARQAMENAEVVAGYHTYLDLVPELIAGKEVIGSGMMQEVERCEAAVEKAKAGSRVAVISSGDPGIYGMAGLVLELVVKLPEPVRPEVRIIPGVSAVGSAAAVLGAPLMHDFAVISMSDLMTPWDLIEKRVKAAAEADFVIAIYNPKSMRRTEQIEKVREIVLRHRPATTPVGVVRSVSRPDQEAVITTLDRFTEEKIDMFTTVIIGNSQTFQSGGFMITPRGYAL